MAFVQTELGFAAGIFSNRSARASQGRWVDGNLVRFRDGVPAQMGGWRKPGTSGAAIAGRARDILSYRPNNQQGRYAAIGTNSNAYLFDGFAVSDITPTGFVAGRQDSVIGNGYGTGPFGGGTYGTPRTGGTGLVLTAGGWTFDMFGEVLLGCGVGDGTIYEFLIGTDTKLKPVTNAPKAQAICVSDERHVFAFGCNGNPNMVMWCDRENRTVWTPLATNRAGFYEMQATSAFQCGRRCRGLIAAWTQTECFVFEPLSNSLVYSYDRVGTQCGAMGPHAVAVVNDPAGDVAYWMSRDNFYIYDGSVRVLTCDLWDYVFKDLNIVQRAKVQARVNSKFGEIFFFYCSAGSDEIDRAVSFEFATGAWSKVTLSRLVWLDVGIFPLPIAIGPDGSIYEHETGSTTDIGAPVPSFVLSAPMTSGVGQQFIDIDEFWPDMQEDSGSCTVSFITRDYGGADPLTFGPYAFDTSTEKIDLAVSARHVQILIQGAGGPWELGVPLLSQQGGSFR